MTTMKTIAAAALFAALATAAMAAEKGPTLQDRQQAACATDAERLCPGLAPDIAKVTACMKDKRAQVSPTCAAMYDTK